MRYLPLVFGLYFPFFKGFHSTYLLENLFSILPVALLQLDPTPFTAFGVLGALLFVIVIMGGLIYHLITKQATHFETREQQFMNFIGAHTDKTNSALKENTDKHNTTLKEISSGMQLSLSKLESVISQNTERLSSVLLLREVERRLEAAKRKGDALDDTVIERVVRNVINEQKGNK